MRITCCIIAALILAAAVFIFIYLGWQWGLISLFAAGLFTALTFLFKSKQESEDIKEQPKCGDFITGAPSESRTDETGNNRDDS